MELAPLRSNCNYFAALAANLGLSKQGVTLAFTISALQPMTFITSLMERDMTGQLLVTVSAYLLIINRESPVRLLAALPFSMFLAYCMRETYMLIPLAIVGVIFFASGANRSRKWNNTFLLILPAFLVSAYFALPFVFSTSTGRFSDELASTSVGHFLVALPFATIKGIVGPFPWIQIFSAPPGVEYMPQDFLQHILNLPIYMIAIPVAYGMWKSRHILDPLVCYAACLFLLGCFGGLHTQYLSIGTVLLIPAASSKGKEHFVSALLSSVGLFTLANVIYTALGLTGQDLFNGLI